MKKNYITPEIELFLLKLKEDICTLSAGVLDLNEFENEEQWWFQ